MPIEIICSDTAAKQLRKMDRGIVKRIFGAVSNLRYDFQESVSKISHTPYYKLRVGDFRVIFDLDEEKLRILLINSAS